MSHFSVLAGKLTQLDLVQTTTAAVVHKHSGPAAPVRVCFALFLSARWLLRSLSLDSIQI